MSPLSVPAAEMSTNSSCWPTLPMLSGASVDRMACAATAGQHTAGQHTAGRRGRRECAGRTWACGCVLTGASTALDRLSAQTQTGVTGSGVFTGATLLASRGQPLNQQAPAARSSLKHTPTNQSAAATPLPQTHTLNCRCLPSSPCGSESSRRGQKCCAALLVEFVFELVLCGRPLEATKWQNLDFEK